MLKINLVPFEELEDKRWYLPDLIVVVGLGISIALGFSYNLTQVRGEIAEVQSETSAMEAAITQLTPKIEHFKKLTSEVASLREQLASLERITTAKVPRYRPVIILEKLQKLKPEGLWFRNLAEKTAASSITLSGESFDKLLIAQFISALSNKKNLPVEPANFASTISFANVNLKQLQDQGIAGAAEAGKPQQHPTIHYEITLRYQEKAPNS